MERNKHIKPGTLVLRQDSLLIGETEGDRAAGEYGRVIHCFLTQGDIWDCYVAFFGNSIPVFGEKIVKPYVLRYYCSSLEIIEEKKQNYVVEE